ncbi:hypothetical protein P3T27_001044 [Kitasatospora sp. MAA19]|uniref:hypothetical protein n=1 Tax=unclassified Kitasatospora TaxID=2633591 RepID=UPI00247652DF|nr:hypothetical protein [Kitasatospora sp. MAA19]MDH6704343.1 hypothetical protein [Kitasatospora sp. MAA19]
MLGSVPPLADELALWVGLTGGVVPPVRVAVGDGEDVGDGDEVGDGEAVGEAVQPDFPRHSTR